MIFRSEVGKISVELELKQIGADYVATISGGNQPHIGCAVLAIPRPSLSDPSEISCTSSVLNCVGHKDEEICRLVAEILCKRLNTTVVCTGGIHVDNISKHQISDVRSLVFNLLEEATV